MAKVITISVLNRSDKTIVTDAALKDFVDTALQPQVSSDFFPAWNIDAQVTFADKPLPGSWWLVVLNNTDQSNWFGYHLTEDGLPFGKVFAQTIDRRGCSWTVSVSHELLEMLADPYINRMVCDSSFDPTKLPTPGEKTAGFYALEVCDPCASDDDAYPIGRYQVSDFILPSWYQKESCKPFDKNNKILQPFGVSKGGYVGRYSNEDGWQLITQGNMSPYRDVIGLRGRTWLRTSNRWLWKPVPAGMI
jgi:hypothetical protein